MELAVKRMVLEKKRLELFLSRMHSPVWLFEDTDELRMQLTKKYVQKA
jgi:hypothetical protein